MTAKTNSAVKGHGPGGPALQVAYLFTASVTGNSYFSYLGLAGVFS
jgi:hypothetical protein